MKRFMNSKSDIVSEAIDGFLLSSTNKNLARLDGYPHIKVVVRTDWDKSRVALISGGGSGHEPAHAGFVGEGMLSAAICGEIFASPSVDAVLAGILAVTGEAGALLIVKNYTGDRLNFGLAAERAKSLGLKVEVVIVADDVAIPGASQPRGVAGTLFVHKIAGYLAAQGANLSEVSNAARAVAESSATIGLALETCTVPGNKKADYLAEDQVELGLGIHGEPGVSKISMDSADNLMQQVCGALERECSPAGGKYAALINNLGAVPPLEMAILATAFAKTSLAGHVDMLIGPAHLMTSLDMNGFSVSLVQLDAERRQALASNVDAPAWPGIRVGAEVKRAQMPDAIEHVSYEPSEAPQTRNAVMAICEMLISSEQDLNALDARVGDGDTGSTFAGGARSIRGDINSFPFARAEQLCAALSANLTRSMGGSSGVLLSILLVATGKSLSKGKNWPDAVMDGVLQMQTYGGAKRGDRTMLDALIPALEKLQQGGNLAEAAIAARSGADATAAMEQASAGRSSYLSAETLIGVVDPGAEVMARVFATLSS